MNPTIPSRSNIESKEVIEGVHYDFKSELSFLGDDDGKVVKDKGARDGKVDFVDDVVAFLNRGAAHIIVGVAEKKGAYDHWRPLRGDVDAISTQLQSIIQDNIDPSPSNVTMEAIELDDGFALDIRIPEHRMRPYQNKLTGGFKIRTDKQNKVIKRDELPSYFTPAKTHADDLHRLMAEERLRLAERAIMTQDGPVLEIGVLPREHYQDHPRLGRSRTGWLYPYDYNEHGTFKGCAGGSEIKDLRGDDLVNNRLFVSDEWFVHATVVHPFRKENDGRVGIHEMKPKLLAYLENIGELFSQAEVLGPFAIKMEFRELKRNPKVGLRFHDNGPVWCGPRGLVEHFDPPALAEMTYESIVRASTYG